jgi:hypothetical protein
MPHACPLAKCEYWWTPPARLGTSTAFDLITDPKEEFPETALRNSWNAEPTMNIIVEFEKSMKRCPLIAPGTPDPYTPPGSRRSRAHITKTRS